MSAIFGAVAAGCIGLRALRMPLRKKSLVLATATVMKRDCTTQSASVLGHRSFRLALCQLRVSSDKSANLKSTAHAIRDAAVQGAHIVTLPECFQSPYATDKFADYAEEIPNSAEEILPEKHPSMAMLRNEAERNKVYIIGGSIPERCGKQIFNTCVVFGPDGSILTRYRKSHLFDIDIPGKICFKESETLTGGDHVAAFEFKKQNSDQIAGDEIVCCRIGIGICYDMRFAEMAQIQRDAGCAMLVYPGAFNTTTGPMHWELIQRARANDAQVYFAACSPARSLSSEGYQAWGHSTVVDPWGKVLASCDHDPATVIADVDLDVVDLVRQSIPTSQQKRRDLYNANSMRIKPEVTK